MNRPNVLGSLAGIVALFASGFALATETWPRLPMDPEIEALRQQFRSEYTQTIAPCAAACPAGDEVQAQVCRAQACAGRCQLGRELLESKVHEVETVKAHQPRDLNPVSGGYLFALTMVARTVDNCRGGQQDETEYAIWMLEWREGGWYWSSNRLGVAAESCGSPPARCRVRIVLRPRTPAARLAGGCGRSRALAHPHVRPG
ncbi:MAG: hypothetical protein IPK27_08870 [Rhodanobacteraceae bacterium]|nr:hypothetical protein [Rhodanobacteraceae bacterium]